MLAPPPTATAAAHRWLTLLPSPPPLPQAAHRRLHPRQRQAVTVAAGISVEAVKDVAGLLVSRRQRLFVCSLPSAAIHWLLRPPRLPASPSWLGPCPWPRPLQVFSALPFVAVQALADSQYGKDLMARLEAEKPLLKRQAQQREAERRAARKRSPWFGEARPLWLGPLSAAPPTHLT